MINTEVWFRIWVVLMVSLSYATIKSNQGYSEAYLESIYSQLEKQAMENQHREIKGYRELTPEEIALMNEAKALGEQCGQLIEKLEAMHDTDKRCVANAKTQLQTGFMWATRSVARPESF